MERKASFLIEHDVREANEDKFVILICRLNSNKGVDETFSSLMQLQVHLLHSSEKYSNLNINSFVEKVALRL